MPPDRTGSIPANITQQVTLFGELINNTYHFPVASAVELPFSAPCSKLIVEVQIPSGSVWNQLALSEDLSPQLIASYNLEAWDAASSTWVVMTGGGIHGGTVGSRVVDYGLEAYQNSTAIRFVCTSVIEESMNATLTQFSLYQGYWPS